MNADWTRQAGCISHDPELWFPATTRDLQDPNGPARTICSTCPVQRDCLDTALRLERGQSPAERWGIRAGLGPTERAQLDRKHKASA